MWRAEVMSESSTAIPIRYSVFAHAFEYESWDSHGPHALTDVYCINAFNGGDK
jgi:hypothetical protein